MIGGDRFALTSHSCSLARMRPLAIQMEALLYLASAAPDTEPAGIDVLLRRVLGIGHDHVFF